MVKRVKSFKEKLADFIEDELGFEPSPWQLTLLVDMFQQRNKTALIEAVPTREEGLRTYTVRPGTHTLVLDERTLRKATIVKFLETLRQSPHTTALTEKAGDEILAVAVAEFNVTLADLGEIMDPYKLSDHALATILRIRHDMENPT